MPVEYLTPRIEDRALEVQLVLAERDQHRTPSVPDLLIAATAKLADLTVLQGRRADRRVHRTTYGTPRTQLTHSAERRPARLE
jgi:predicted nucleic acid-binding protein